MLFPRDSSNILWLFHGSIYANFINGEVMCHNGIFRDILKNQAIPLLRLQGQEPGVNEGNRVG